MKIYTIQTDRTKRIDVKTLVTLSVLTALYVVLSAMFKIAIGVGNIALDMGYIAFTIALFEYGPLGTAVGVLGCSIESMIFAAHGFSISWAVANLVIGICCGYAFTRFDKLWMQITAILLSCAIGLIGAKTLIECMFFSVPIEVRIPRNAIACAADAAAMLIGLWIAPKLHRKINQN